MSDEQKPFWSTVPGILTGLAALITAITGLYVALKPDTESADVGNSNADVVREEPPTRHENIEVVEILPEGSEIRSRYGFFTPKGYIITMSTSEEAPDLTAVWYDGREERRFRLRAVAPAIDKDLPVELFEPVGADLGRFVLPIRTSRTVRVGERLEKYLSSTDRSFGEVLETGAERDIWTSEGTVRLQNLIITTQFSIVGDAGAPVVDRDGNVVGILYASSQEETIVIPIEEVKASYLQGF